MMNKDDEIINKIANDIKNSDEYIPQMPVGTFLSIIRPEINRKSMELKHKHRNRIENLQLLFGYLLFIILAPLLAFDYVVNGFTVSLAFTATVIGIVSVMSLCCIPLIVKFMENK